MGVSAEPSFPATPKRVPVAQVRLVEAGRVDIIFAVCEVTGEPVVAPPLPPLLAYGGLA